MTRIPQIKPEDMNAEQKRVHDHVMATTGRSAGPAIGYAYAPGLWESNNTVSDHLADCSLSQRQVRIAAIATARHWNAPFPFAVQVRADFEVGVEPALVEAINDGARPDFANPEEAAVLRRDPRAAGRRQSRRCRLRQGGCGARAPKIGRYGRRRRPFLHGLHDGQHGRRDDARRGAGDAENIRWAEPQSLATGA